MRFLLPLMLVLASCWASKPILHVTSQATQQLDDYRLPLEAVPIEYDITLAPTFESEKETNKSFTFEGLSKITLNINESTNIITFHASKESLTINEVTLQYYVDYMRPVIQEPIKVLSDTQRDFVQLIFKKQIPATIATLSLLYTGKLNDELRGFYKSSYQNKDGKTK
ncbi:PREDICTED: aminopeptidase 2 [Wasmannia auropunctata]|uniref:aminopeptidase 2 n=1 Tax=Wasmannia auropunctata TaxID=64793 RepID=UPI0005EEC341|nr:PREDICTED: aminopeptidase 2 [Wasmannia auropunctata]